MAVRHGARGTGVGMALLLEAERQAVSGGADAWGSAPRRTRSASTAALGYRTGGACSTTRASRTCGWSGPSRVSPRAHPGGGGSVLVAGPADTGHQHDDDPVLGAIGERH